VSGDLLDEFGGEGREVRCRHHVGCLILPVRIRHFWERLVGAFLVGGDEDGDDDVAATAAIFSVSSTQEIFVCLPAARLPACSVGQGWTSRVTVSVPGTSGGERRLSRNSGSRDGYIVRQDKIENKEHGSESYKQSGEKGSLIKYTWM
jgi:hypothetical protein